MSDITKQIADGMSRALANYDGVRQAKLRSAREGMDQAIRDTAQAKREAREQGIAHRIFGRRLAELRQERPAPGDLHVKADGSSRIIESVSATQIRLDDGTFVDIADLGPRE
jgi:hypothetical protein